MTSSYTQNHSFVPVPQPPPSQNTAVTSAVSQHPPSNSSRRSSFTIPVRPRAHSSHHSTSPYVVPSPTHFQYPQQQQIYNHKEQQQQQYYPPVQNGMNTLHNSENIDTAQQQQQSSSTSTHSRSPSENNSGSVPLLTREFVVRRISEGETGRLKQELKCEACGKGYKHISSLAKHLWEHTAEWNYTKKLLISKHQQVQLLEAASILVSMNENDKKKQQQQTTALDSTSTGTGDHTHQKTSSASPIAQQYNYPQSSSRTDQQALHNGPQYGSAPVNLVQDPRASFNNNSQRPILNNLDANHYFESPHHQQNRVEYVVNVGQYPHANGNGQHAQYMESAIDEEEDDEEEYINDDARSQ